MFACSNHADESESNSLSAGAAAGITFIITFLVALPVGVAIGLGVAWLVCRRGRSHTSKGLQQKMEQQEQGTRYMKPPETDICLSDNQAYGQVDI